MYDEEAQRSSQNYLAIGSSLEEKCKTWEGGTRHGKEIWHIARRVYLRGLVTYISDHVLTFHPLTVCSGSGSDAPSLSTSPTTPEKNPHGLESQIILFDETVPQRPLIPYG